MGDQVDVKDSGRAPHQYPDNQQVQNTYLKNKFMQMNDKSNNQPNPRSKYLTDPPSK